MRVPLLGVRGCKTRQSQLTRNSRPGVAWMCGEAAGVASPVLRREGGEGARGVCIGGGHTWVLGEAREEGTQSNPASTCHPGNRHQSLSLTFQIVLPYHMPKPLNGFTLQARNLGPYSCSSSSLP